MKLKSDVKIEGCQFAAIQCSQDEILLFGSYFKSEFPTFSQVNVYKFNHELKQITKETKIMNQVNGDHPEDENHGLFT